MKGLERKLEQYSYAQFSIKKEVLSHWNPAHNDIVQWVVVDGDNRVKFTARTREQAQRFINMEGV